MAQDVVVIIGAGGIGAAIARRQGFGKTLLLADWNEELLASTAEALRDASYRVEAQRVDVASRASVAALADAAAALGSVVQVVNTAGLSPNMASVDRVLAVDLYGTAVVFEEFGRVIAPGGAGLVVSSMAGHMAQPLPAEVEQALAFTPADELLALPCLSAEAVPDSMIGYIISKRANFLRVQAEAIRWGERGARVNAISPGIIATPLARHSGRDKTVAMAMGTTVAMPYTWTMVTTTGGTATTTTTTTTTLDTTTLLTTPGTITIRTTPETPVEEVSSKPYQ